MASVRGAGLDHHQDAARLLEQRDEVLRRLADLDVLARVLGEELLGLARRAVVDRDREAVLLDVQGDVPAHDFEPDDAERLRAHRAIVVEAGAARVKPSSPKKHAVACCLEVLRRKGDIVAATDGRPATRHPESR